MIHWQQPDWQKLYLQGSCKFPNVPFTDEEVKLINKDWKWDMKVVTELRTGYLRANEQEFVDPKGGKTKTVEPVLQSAELEVIDPIVEVSQEAVEPVVESLEELQRQYEEKLGKPVPNNKKNDIEWIKSRL